MMLISYILYNAPYLRNGSVAGSVRNFHPQQVQNNDRQHAAIVSKSLRSKEMNPAHSGPPLPGMLLFTPPQLQSMTVASVQREGTLAVIAQTTAGETQLQGTLAVMAQPTARETLHQRTLAVMALGLNKRNIHLNEIHASRSNNFIFLDMLIGYSTNKVYTMYTVFLYQFSSSSMIRFSQSKLLPKQGLFHLEKKEDTIQYGYRKWGTHARVFSKTLVHGNSKNEQR